MLSDVECEIASALDLPGKNMTAEDMVDIYAEDFLNIKNENKKRKKKKSRLSVWEIWVSEW